VRTYRINFKVPWLSWGVEVNDNLLVRQAKLLYDNVSAMGPWAAMVRIESDLWGVTVDSCHDEVEITRVRLFSMTLAMTSSTDDAGDFARLLAFEKRYAYVLLYTVSRSCILVF
jgi:hypothetical protein